ncbi:hypothetical protein [uncultured Nocardioides sp.]|uniref:hypothetical protein n=1 Tax=uncultured Nocardioides sp. TaxID=198441 RepID=UPI00262F1619|nr:hypothetical protein [uncultured Nocardioides sp.]
MEIDWERELDGVVGGGAGGDRPPSDFVVPGRRALSRRRAALTGASVAAVAVVIGLGVSVGGATGLVGQGPTGAGFAVDPTSAPSPEADPVTESCSPSDRDTFAEYDGVGRLCVAAGAAVVQRVADPMAYGEGRRRSIGLVVEREGEREFVLATWRRGSSSTTQRPAVGALEEWLPAVVAAQRLLDGDAVPDETLTLDASGEVVAGEGITVVDQRDVDLGPSFAPPGSPAVAVELEVNGERTFALLRRVDGTTDVIPSRIDFFDLDAFVADARERYDSGEGVL